MAAIAPGACVHLRNDHSHNLYQVIGIRSEDSICWLRIWPLRAKGNPVFQTTLNRILPSELEAAHG